MGQISHSGWTLVDVVGQVFSRVAGAISKVKNLASQALNAVKDGLEFISNYVLSVINGVLASMVKYSITSVFTVLSALWGGLDVESGSNSVKLKNGGNEVFRVDISNDENSLSFELNGIRIILDSPFNSAGSPFDIETLGFPPESNLKILGTWLLSFAAIGLIVAKTPVTRADAWLIMNTILLGLTVFGFIAEKKILDDEPSQTEKTKLISRLAQFHLSAGVALLLSVIKRASDYPNTKYTTRSSNTFNDLARDYNTLTGSYGPLNAIGNYIHIFEILAKLKYVGAFLLGMLTGFETYDSMSTYIDIGKFLFDAIQGDDDGDLATNILFNVIGGTSGGLPYLITEQLNNGKYSPTKSRFKAYVPTLFVIGMIHLMSAFYYLEWDLYNIF